MIVLQPFLNTLLMEAMNFAQTGYYNNLLRIITKLSVSFFGFLKQNYFHLYVPPRNRACSCKCYKLQRQHYHLDTGGEATNAAINSDIYKY